MKKKKQAPRPLATHVVQQVAKRSADGHLHLALHRDANGHEHATLSSPVFGVAWLDELALGAASTTLGVFGEQPSFARAALLAERITAAASRLTEGMLSRSPERVACRSGCDHCCHQSVAVTLPEALAIVAHLREAWTSDELLLFTARLAERVERTRGTSADERFSPELPCLFLREGSCSIYEVRPLVCRGMNSLDASDCARRLRDATARAEFLARGAGGRCFLEPIQATQAISAGLQLAGSELYGLDLRPLDLAAALLLLLNGNTALEQAWLGGGAPLQGAVR
jgi:hypothetical protein